MLFLLIENQTLAQQQPTEKELRKKPHWIQMMDDTLSNYFEVTRAFDIYFSAHELPKEEDEIIGMKSGDEEDEKKSNWLRRLFPVRRNEEETEMAFQVKKYRRWVMLTQPWVQEDGSIQFPSERKRILDNISR